jgi:hypothetical protein
VRYIEGDITAADMPFWLECFEAAPAPLSWEDKLAFMQQLDGVALSSDAFFPFRCGPMCHMVLACILLFLDCSLRIL